MVSIQEPFPLLHFTFHCQAKMINNFVLETLYYYSTVMEILDNKVNMLAVQTDHDADT